MALRPLSTLLLLELLELFEQSSQPIGDAEGQRLHGVPGSHMVDRTSLTADEISAWTERVGYVGSYPADFGDECVPVDLQEDDAPDRYWYRCPETFRKKYVSAANAAVYAVFAPKILNHIADLLGIPQALRRMINKPAIEGVLWQLGEARIGPGRIQVWFARGLSDSVNAIFRHFRSLTLPEQGLILFTGDPLPEFVRPPRNYRFASMRQALVDYVTTPFIDMNLLHRILTSPADGTPSSVLAVHFDVGSSVLTIRTKKEQWHIKGERQSAAVAYMYEQACQDRWLLDAAEILDAAYPDKQSGKSIRMQNLFSGNDQWKDYIANPEKGKYAFNLD